MSWIKTEVLDKTLKLIFQTRFFIKLTFWEALASNSALSLSTTISPISLILSFINEFVLVFDRLKLNSSLIVKGCPSTGLCKKKFLNFSTILYRIMKAEIASRCLTLISLETASCTSSLHSWNFSKLTHSVKS